MVWVWILAVPLASFIPGVSYWTSRHRCYLSCKMGIVIVSASIKFLKESKRLIHLEECLPPNNTFFFFFRITLLHYLSICSVSKDWELRFFFLILFFWTFGGFFCVLGFYCFFFLYTISLPFKTTDFKAWAKDFFSHSGFLQQFNCITIVY